MIIPGMFEEAFIEERRKGLEIFLNKFVNTLVLISNRPLLSLDFYRGHSNSIEVTQLLLRSLNFCRGHSTSVEVTHLL